MKEDIEIPQEMRDSLTVPIAQRKWMSLQKEFKSVFYNFDDNFEENATFPFYNKMNDLFTDYASKHLNASRGIADLDTSANQTSEAEVTAFIMHLLDNSADISQLRCESSDEQILPFKISPVNRSFSEASNVRKALTELPKDSISVQETKLKIIPNTPFNRRCQISTILKYRNTKHSLLQSSDQNYESNVKRQRLSSPTPSNISILEAPNDTLEYEIEALNECDLSEVPRIINPEIKQIKLQKTSTPVLQKISKKSFSSDIMIVEPEPCSFLEVPSLEFDSVNDLRTNSSLQVVPKNLSWTGENLSSSKNARIDEPPAWFRTFVDRHDAEMNKVNVKMNEINAKLETILAQRQSST